MNTFPRITLFEHNRSSEKNPLRIALEVLPTQIFLAYFIMLKNTFNCDQTACLPLVVCLFACTCLIVGEYRKGLE